MFIERKSIFVTPFCSSGWFGVIAGASISSPSVAWFQIRRSFWVEPTAPAA